MTGGEWLIVIAALALVAGVGIPLLARFIRKKDFDAQVSGKKPTRQLRENDRPVTNENDSSRAEYEKLKYEAELKSKQNAFGPK